jgi:hypothetical protein
MKKSLIMLIHIPQERHRENENDFIFSKRRERETATARQRQSQRQREETARKTTSQRDGGRNCLFEAFPSDKDTNGCCSQTGEKWPGAAAGYYGCSISKRQCFSQMIKLAVNAITYKS